jgi:hypothetical protein
MWFSIGSRLIVSALWVAFVLAILYPFGGVAGWLSDKIEGDDPGKLRETFATMVAIFVAVLIGLTGNAIVRSLLVFVIWWHFP